MPLPFAAHQERLRKFWYANARQIVIGVMGGSIILVGFVTVLTPVPSTPIFVLGFAVLASEFLWAKRILRRSKAYLKDKLPDAHAARIDHLFKRVVHHSKHIVGLVHHHIVKPLTPRRKRVKLPEPVEGLPVVVISEPVKDPAA